MRRVLLVLVAAGAIAVAQDTGELEQGVAALDKKDWTAALEHLQRARAQKPESAVVLYQLGRAFEGKGAASDALHCWAAAARLDPDGTGPKAKDEAARLRKRWTAIELEDGDDALRGKDVARAKKAFARAFELLAADDARRTQAREGYATACASELARSALEGAAKGTTVAIEPIADRSSGGANELMVRALELALAKAFTAAGAAVIESGAAASLVITGTSAQTIVLRARDAKGTFRAALEVRLLRGSNNLDLPPDPIGLTVKIEAFRDAPGKAPLELTVSEGATLRSNDRFRIRATAKAALPVHFYAFILDSQKKVTRLFPDTEEIFPDLKKAGIRARNPVRDGKLVVPPLPQGGGTEEWFFLDDHPGRETFYVAASVGPLEDVDGVLRQMSGITAEGDQARRLARLLEARAEEASIGSSGGTEEISARGAAVRYVTVEHAR